MIRITGGTLRGQLLESTGGGKIRPTSGFMREVLFSMAAGALPGALVLDLFAGAGTLGIEAISRGAGKCVFVELKPKHAGIITRNLVHCGLDKSQWVMALANVLHKSTYDALKKGGLSGFDLVLLDPPYGEGLVPKALLLLDREGMARPGTMAVAEHESALVLPEPLGPWRLLKSRRHGDTTVTLLTWGDEPVDEDPSLPPE